MDLKKSQIQDHSLITVKTDETKQACTIVQACFVYVKYKLLNCLNAKLLMLKFYRLKKGQGNP